MEWSWVEWSEVEHANVTIRGISFRFDNIGVKYDARIERAKV